MFFRNQSADVYVNPVNQPYDPFNDVIVYNAEIKGGPVGGMIGGPGGAATRPVTNTKYVTTKVGGRFSVTAPAGYVVKGYNREYIQFMQGIMYSAPQPFVGGGGGGFGGRQVGGGGAPKGTPSAANVPLNTFATALKAGNTTITLFNEQQNKQIIYKITIKPVITKKSIASKIGASFKITATGYGTLMPYEDGYIGNVKFVGGVFMATPVKAGTVDITFQADNGNKLIYTLTIPKPTTKTLSGINIPTGKLYNLNTIPLGYNKISYTVTGIVSVSGNMSNPQPNPQPEAYYGQASIPPPQPETTEPFVIKPIKAGSTVIIFTNKFTDTVKLPVTVYTPPPPAPTTRNMTASGTVGVEFRIGEPPSAYTIASDNKYIKVAIKTRTITGPTMPGIGPGRQAPAITVQEYYLTPLKVGTTTVTLTDKNKNKVVYTVTIKAGTKPDTKPSTTTKTANAAVGAEFGLLTEPADDYSINYDNTYLKVVTKARKLPTSVQPGPGQSVPTQTVNTYYATPLKAGTTKITLTNKKDNKVIVVYNVYIKAPSVANTITINGIPYTILRGPRIDPESGNKTYALSFKGRKYLAVYYKATGKWTVADQGAMYYSSGVTVPKSLTGVLLVLGTVGASYFVVKKMRD